MSLWNRDLKDFGKKKKWIKCIEVVSLNVVVYTFVFLITSAYFNGSI